MENTAHLPGYTGHGDGLSFLNLHRDGTTVFVLVPAHPIVGGIVRDLNTVGVVGYHVKG